MITKVSVLARVSSRPFKMMAGDRQSIGQMICHPQFKCELAMAVIIMEWDPAHEKIVMNFHSISRHSYFYVTEIWITKIG